MMEKMPEIKVEKSGEREKSILAHITFSRHGETRYTDQYPDITEDAVQRAQDKGGMIATKKGAPERIIHSPAVRAKGTADAIHMGVGVKDEQTAINVHQSRQIRPSDIPDHQKANALFTSMSKEEVARQHHIDDGIFADGSVMETPESKRVRLYRSLEYLIRSLTTKKDDKKSTAPHIVVVSHYELVSILLGDVFGDLKELFGRYNVPSFGEHIDVILFRTDDPNIVTVEIDFDGKTARRDFDRSKRFFV